MSLFEEVVRLRFFLGTPSTVATTSLRVRGQAFILVAWCRPALRSSLLRLLDSVRRLCCSTPLTGPLENAWCPERKYSNTGVCGIAEAVVHELLQANPGWIVAVCEFDAVVLLCTVVRDKLRGLHVCSFGSPLENSTCRDLILSKLYQWLD